MMNSLPTSELRAADVASGMSIFDIDESLAALVEAAEADAEANSGEISEAIKEALIAYAHAFGQKVDRIADFLKAQKAEAEAAQREAERLHARQKAAENREKRLKQMLMWFMVTRGIQKMRGELNTISIQGNSAPTLVVNDGSHIPATFYRARIDLTWLEWLEVVESLPEGKLRERIVSGAGNLVQKGLERGLLSDALRRGEFYHGATLVKGTHIRLR